MLSFLQRSNRHKSTHCWTRFARSFMPFSFLAVWILTLFILLVTALSRPGSLHCKKVVVKPFSSVYFFTFYQTFRLKLSHKQTLWTKSCLNTVDHCFPVTAETIVPPQSKNTIQQISAVRMKDTIVINIGNYTTLIYLCFS